MAKKLLQITAPYFVAGLEIDRDGLCAPILHYMRGWSYIRVQEYCKQRGWVCEVLTVEDDVK